MRSDSVRRRPFLPGSGPRPALTAHRVPDLWTEAHTLGGLAYVGNLRRVVIDVLKPLEPSIVTLVQMLADFEGVDGVNISIYEIDRRVENAKLTVEGHNVPYQQIVDVIEENGAAVHSIDEVAAGKILIEDVITPQD